MLIVASYYNRKTLLLPFPLAIRLTMRLLQVISQRLESFNPDSPEMLRYAILSHVWGKEEVTCEDIGNLLKAKRMLGFEKIRLSCVRAKRDGLRYVWVDTC